MREGTWGVHELELGICPATIDASSDGLNGGENGGRICWAVSGTFCGGKVQGSFAKKQVSCMNCDLYRKVEKEEGLINFRLLKPDPDYSKKAIKSAP